VYLRSLKQFNEQEADSKAIERMNIEKRRLTAIQHNTWQPLGAENHVALKLTKIGRVEFESHLVVENFHLDPMVALILKLQYVVRVNYRDGSEKLQTYLIGWSSFIPTLKGDNGDIMPDKKEVKFNFGPGVALTGELMWDQSISKKQFKSSAIQL